MSTIGVVALQGAVSEHLAMLVRLGADVREVRTPQDLAGLDGLVLPGGESTAMARSASRVGLFEAVGQSRERGLPVLGTCAGLVLLAEEVVGGEALQGWGTVGGLNVTARRNAFGGQLASFTEDLHVEGLAERFPAVFIRAPQVVQVGPGVEVLARTAAGAVVAVRQGRLWATSFHPELTGDDRLHRLFLSNCSRSEAA